ncbi:MAG: cell division protein FtsA [Lentisphaeria bacterium]|nr:cell division protein FtsA [Lentisphaeria bacterium]
MSEEQGGAGGMVKDSEREIHTGVEIGTSSIKVVMGEFSDDDQLDIVGYGEVPSLKVRKGEPVNVGIVEEQLERAFQMAESSAGTEVTGHVFLAVTGSHIRTFHNAGVHALDPDNPVISNKDVTMALAAARRVSLEEGEFPVHFMNRHFRVDQQLELNNPVGQAGAELEADMHVVAGNCNRLETSCALLADILGERPATDIVFSPLAAALATLNPDTARQGVLVIDIGEGVTEYVCQHGPACRHSGQFAVGCANLVNDLMLGLGLSLPQGREILHRLGDFGSAVWKDDGRARMTDVASEGARSRLVPASSIERIIRLRLEEIFLLIRGELEKIDETGSIGAGIRLCGGGALIPGVIDLATEVFGLPVEQARARAISGPEEVCHSPRFITPLGLLRWGQTMLTHDVLPEKPLTEHLRDDIRTMAKVIRDALHW